VSCLCGQDGRIFCYSGPLPGESGEEDPCLDNQER
jgi:hypothetical protein